MQSPQRQNFRQVPPPQTYENYAAQCQYLSQIAELEIPKVEMSPTELFEKEKFRSKLEVLCQEALTEGYTGEISSIALKCFGSIRSGFATQGSDVDLAIVPSWVNPSSTLTHSSRIDRDIPRLFEKKLLEKGFGARLLTRTRVPILKVCEKPTPELYVALCEERKKWDDLPEEEKYPVAPTPQESTPPPAPLVAIDGQTNSAQNIQHHSPNSKTHTVSRSSTNSTVSEKDIPQSPTRANEPTTPTSTSTAFQDNSKDPKTPHQNRPEKPWLREKALGPLDFPKSGIGIQSDMNFSNPLALHNTQLLRCYSICDPRVRPMVLFVKTWAKRRKINSSYSGTLSSYGYVLMVLHYLVNVAQPPVCPNLQLCYRPRPGATPEQIAAETTVEGYEVRFWGNEEEIADAANRRRLTVNNQSLGVLLCGFFQYYANLKFNGQSFIWTSEVLSLRTLGGIRDKREKGWTAAKTTTVDGKEVRHRYLFAIEDPFEWDHNVARTVTHNGIVTIRDEFRRAWRLLVDVGNGRVPDGELCEQVVEASPLPVPKAVKAGDIELGLESAAAAAKAGTRNLENALAQTAVTYVAGKSNDQNRVGTA
ncbi:PAP/OAS1 substrate-binding domain-containing protein [Glonium stellatum]|uniref:polynucleotide adenylyltransferase n=1 Tax=Glonium stellatum TaxID=574774 RepID=A0A8E2JLN5_9PEZI|nr:PAP/OAS1 substrate-binding domain-containing protein [Glonium stellatum]